MAVKKPMDPYAAAIADQEALRRDLLDQIAQIDADIKSLRASQRRRNSLGIPAQFELITANDGEFSSMSIPQAARQIARARLPKTVKTNDIVEGLKAGKHPSANGKNFATIVSTTLFRMNGKEGFVKAGRGSWTIREKPAAKPLPIITKKEAEDGAGR